MSKQIKQEPQDELKVIQELHLESLRKSLSEDNPLFKEVVEAKEILEEIKGLLQELYAKNAEETEIQEMKAYQTFWKLLKQKRDNEWQIFQKAQKGKIAELNQQMKLHQIATQAEKKRANNNAKMAMKKSQSGSQKKSNIQVKNQEKQQQEMNRMENPAQQIQKVKDQETKKDALKEIEQNEKEDKEKTDANFKDISYDASEASTMITMMNTPNKPLNNKEDISPQHAKIKGMTMIRSIQSSEQKNEKQWQGNRNDFMDKETDENLKSLIQDLLIKSNYQDKEIQGLKSINIKQENRNNQLENEIQNLKKGKEQQNKEIQNLKRENEQQNAVIKRQGDEIAELAKNVII